MMRVRAKQMNKYWIRFRTREIHYLSQNRSIFIVLSATNDCMLFEDRARTHFERVARPLINFEHRFANI